MVVDLHKPIGEGYTICPYDGSGCGFFVAAQDGKVVNIEGDPDHPVNRGAACAKGASMRQLSADNEGRLQKPRYRKAGGAEALSDVVNQGVWRQRICPICGGKPDFAFLDKERGGRWLLCSRCDMEWLFQRLQCPYCGTQGQKALSYFTNDQGLYRLYTCEECRSYIKAMDLRKTQAEALLPLERILTAQLDRQAVGAGYKAG
jgi:hypothetical protein